ncbi:MAG: FtsQ-type POTRA domain-containing protein [Lentisphaeria bacterium]|nr:FtsQ-type POTRA domain-containing protein [Lentisphaeria bacterium]
MSAKRKNVNAGSGAVRSGGNARTQGLLRVLARSLAWVLAGVVALGILAGGLTGLHYLLLAANPSLTLREIAVDGNRVRTETWVRGRLAEKGVVPGRSNLLSLPVRQLREDLEADALVAKARVFRVLPDTLRVSLVERAPVAVVHCAHPFLLDREGVVLPWPSAAADPLLPVVTGVRQKDRPREGEPVSDEALRGAVRLLRLLSSRPDGVAYDISVIQLDYYLPSLRLHLRPRGAFAQGAQAIVPVQGMEDALERLRDVHRIRSAAGKTISYIDVTYRRNVPVRP